MKIKILLQYALLGIIQGLAEIIPISSSGHLFIFQKILHIQEFNLALEIFLHLASLLALLIFYKEKVSLIIKGFFLYPLKKEKKYLPHFKIGLYLILSSLPAGILGILLKSKIEKVFLNSLGVGISLIITSIILLISKNIKKSNQTLSYKSAISIGFFQSIGLIPGISRSGVTLLGVKHNGINDKQGVDFVFLLLIPICLGAFFFSLNDLSLFFNQLYLIPILISFILAFLFTFVGLKLFYKVIFDEKLQYFAIYCFLIGVLTLLL